MSLLQSAKENNLLTGNNDNSLQEMFLKKNGRDENADDIDDTKEADFHNF